ncbi:Na+/H+ antiporter [Ochrobactrum soli]|uniref:Na+/H+ antiporter n=1 Tax=Ochrobactrum soli TaxID=2448455 RepID=A0A2P9HEV7_9HYPH|nr:Na+/H+ antiporter [[Ochrobactrum] soli]
MVWGQIAVLAGAVVFLLAAVQVPDLLSLMNEADMVYLAVIVLAALVARAIVMFGIFPLLSTAGLSRPVDHRYKLAIVWGGLRGAVTLVLALALAQNEALPPSERQFVAALAAAFVLVSLFFNGLTLRWVAGRLGLTLLSPQQEALQRQAVLLSTAEVETAIGEIAADFQLPKDAVAAVQQDYRSEISQGPGTFTIEDALIEREQLSIGLVTLATREHTLIPEYGSGVISARNLDAMMRNTSLMIDAAREEGRIGYNRAARMILAPTLGYRVASFLAKHLNLRRLLARPLADRFELMICRRAVLERLVAYNNGPLRRFVGNRMGEVLEGVLRGRLKAVDEVLAQLRAHYPGHTRLLERRLLMLFALGRGAKIIEAMKAESVVSTEVALGLEASLRTRWEANISRPVPPQMEEVRISESADSDFSKSRTLVSLIRGQFSRGVFQACC